MGHCSNWGKTCPRAPSHFVDNTDATIRGWIINESKHQQDVINFFNVVDFINVIELVNFFDFIVLVQLN